MAIINLKKKEVQAKIVYYGPGRGGKTTNIEYLYKKFRSRIRTEMVTIKTHGDRTLFFDFLPIEIGKIKGYDIRVQLYTVPGQVKYESTRRLVLRGVDGIVFVADSLAVRRKGKRAFPQEPGRQFGLLQEKHFADPSGVSIQQERSSGRGNSPSARGMARKGFELEAQGSFS